jgi:uncharacterized protein
MNKHVVVIGKIALILTLTTILAVIFSVLLNLTLPNKEIIPEHVLRLINGPKALITILIPLAIILKCVEKQRNWSLGYQTSRKFHTFSRSSEYGILLIPLTLFTIFIFGGGTLDSLHLEGTLMVSFAVGAFLSLCDSFTEELLVRGYIQGLLNYHYGTVVSILFSTVIFALLHSLGHDIFANSFYALNLVLGGLFLALLREMSGSLWVPIGVHFSWNTFNSLIGTENSIITIQSTNDIISGGKLGISEGLGYTILYVIIIAIQVYILKKKSAKLTSTKITLNS